MRARPLLLCLLLNACDDRSYSVGTTAPDSGADSPAQTGGQGGQVVATGGATAGGSGGSGDPGGSGGSSGVALPAVPACSIPGAVIPDRPLMIEQGVLAARLARFLWNTNSDADLLVRAAAARTNRDVQALAAAMTSDARFADGVYALTGEWLELAQAANSGGADEVKGMVDDALRASMLTETITFLRDLFTVGDGKLSTLLQASHSFVDARLARIYDLPMVTGPDFSRVELDKARRSGILTQALFLYSKPRISGRGSWLMNKLLCIGVPPPPNGSIDPPPPERQPGETDRQILERWTSQPNCRPCHALVDPPGYAFEHYDALGRWRDQDSGHPVDAMGSVEQLQGRPDLKFDGARQLGEQLMGSCEVYRCAAQVFLQHALHSQETVNANARDEVVRAFVASGLDLRALYSWVAASPPFLAP